MESHKNPWFQSTTLVCMDLDKTSSFHPGSIHIAQKNDRPCHCPLALEDEFPPNIVREKQISQGFHEFIPYVQVFRVKLFMRVYPYTVICCIALVFRCPN